MRIAVLGTGGVGATLGSKLVQLGHDVRMGSRSTANDKAAAWVTGAGQRASAGTFADAAEYGELVVNATAGTASLAALQAAQGHLDRKVLLDVANALDFSAGFPPRLAVEQGDSLAEQIQRAHPEARVVKALNTMTASVMVEPASVPGPHNVFLAGDDAGAKNDVRRLLATFGWPAADILDAGGLAAARGLEMYLPLWLTLMQTLGTPQFNIHIAR